MLEDRDKVTVLEDRDKVTVLLAEYKSLRDECLQRGAGSFTLVVASTALAVYFMGNWHGCPSIVKAMIVGFVVLTLFRLNWIATKRCSARIRQIESAINILFNERLLVWESFWGAGVGGIGQEFRVDGVADVPPLQPSK